MILGAGDYDTAQEQMHLPKEVLMQCTSCAVDAWKALPPISGKTTTLAEVKQKGDEPYEEFVSRLGLAVSRVISNQEAAEILIRQLAFENANNTCQALLRPIRKTGSTSDYVKQCADVGPAFLQGVAIAAALRGEPYPQVIQSMNQGKKTTSNIIGPFMVKCYSCGQSGHISRNCPYGSSAAPVAPMNSMPNAESSSAGVPMSPSPKSLCPRCMKGYHWQKECKSKFHRNGRILQPINPGNQGNFQRGQPQAPKMIGAFPMQAKPIQPSIHPLPLHPLPQPPMCPEQMNPFFPHCDQSQNSSEQPQVVRDWTSVPPPQQY